MSVLTSIEHINASSCEGSDATGLRFIGQSILQIYWFGLRFIDESIILSIFITPSSQCRGLQAEICALLQS